MLKRKKKWCVAYPTIHGGRDIEADKYCNDEEGREVTARIKLRENEQ